MVTEIEKIVKTTALAQSCTIIKKEGKDEPRESRKFGKNCKSKQYFSLQQGRHAIKYRNNNKFSESSDLLPYKGKEGPLEVPKFLKNRKCTKNFPLQRKKHAKNNARITRITNLVKVQAYREEM